MHHTTSCLLRLDGLASGRETRPADLAYGAVATAGRTVLAAVVDDLQVQGVPALLREHFLQVFLCLGHILAAAQAVIQEDS